MLSLNTRDQQVARCQKHVPHTIRTQPATSWLRLEIQAATRQALRRLLEGIWLNKACGLSRTLKKSAFLTRPTPAITSPARPESAKTASSPKDAPFTWLCSRIAQRLNVPNRTSRLFARCGRAGHFEHPASRSCDHDCFPRSSRTLSRNRFFRSLLSPSQECVLFLPHRRTPRSSKWSRSISTRHSRKSSCFPDRVWSDECAGHTRHHHEACCINSFGRREAGDSIARPDEET